MGKYDAVDGNFTGTIKFEDTKKEGSFTDGIQVENTKINVESAKALAKTLHPLLKDIQQDTKRARTSAN